MKGLFYFTLAAVGALSFISIFGLQIIDPRYDAWLLQRDTLLHYTGWLFFRNEPWHWPLGIIENLATGSGVTITQTDSVPFLAFFFKALPQQFLPEVFQYTGLWLLACFMLQALFGGLLVWRLCEQRIAAFFGAAFFAISPPLLQRFDHKALCAHWLLLASFYCYLRINKDNAKKGIIAFTVLLSLSLFTMPYFVPMVAALQLGFLLRDRQVLYSKINLGLLVAQTILFYGLVLCLGVQHIGGSKVMGWPNFSTDLLSFFNSYGYSSVLPKIRYGGSQHEGFAYLGLGVLLLAFVSAYKWSSYLAEKRLHSLFAVCFCMWIYALSSHVTFGGNVILNLDFLYDHLSFLTGVFRSSGRFVWPLYYLILTLTIALPFRLFSLQKARAILGLALFLQLFDLVPWQARAHEWLQPTFSGALTEKLWQITAEHGRAIKIFPPVLSAEEYSCDDPDIKLGLGLSLYVASRYGLAINSSGTNHMPDEATKTICEATKAEVMKGMPIDGTAYVVSHRYEKLFTLAMGDRVQCVDYPDYKLCLGKQFIAAALSSSQSGADRHTNTEKK